MLNKTQIRAQRKVKPTEEGVLVFVSVGTSDGRVRIRVASEAADMGFITKARMRDISQCYFVRLGRWVCLQNRFYFPFALFRVTTLV
jgi:hypothetical protein